MAILSGKDGAITATPAGGADFVAALHPEYWEITETMETRSARPFGAQLVTTVPGVSGPHTGAARGYMDDTAVFDAANTFDTGKLCAFVLNADDGQTYTASGYVVNFKHVVQSGELCTWDMTFTLTTDVTIAEV